MRYGVVGGVFFSMLGFAAGGGSLGGVVNGVHVSSFVGASLLGGILAGVTLSAFRPFTSSWWGAALLGTIIGLPAYAMLVLFEDGLSGFPKDWLVVAAYGFLICPAAAVGIRFMRRQSTRVRNAPGRGDGRKHSA